MSDGGSSSKVIFGSLSRFLLLGGALLALVSFFMGTVGLRDGNMTIAEADSSYESGDSAKTVYERKKQFNKALDLYLGLESEYNPIFGDGKLYYNIANTYFQVGEYPWAILYYEIAKGLMPREGRVDRNLELAKQKLGIGEKKVDEGYESVFFFHQYLSLPEKLQLFFWLTIISIIFSSTYIWINSVWVKRFVIASFIALSPVAASLAYARYFSPIEAILVLPAELRLDAGKEFAKISKEPIPAGTKVEVYSTNPAGSWVKVVTSKGDVGYIEQASLRLIK